MEKKDQYIINLLLFICFIVSFSFGEKTPVDTYIYMHVPIHIYMKGHVTAQNTVGGQKKPQMPNVKKKRYVQLKQIHCIVLLLLSRLLDYKYFACTIRNCASFLITL